ncbi:MAG: T9SS type A sorting domain-containing protein [Bacteroidales bacterium]|jgi:hypothetical protein|nr:T9SS type A sorting domain-containing protein [Bacteroidales bacterium]
MNKLVYILLFFIAIPSTQAQEIVDNQKLWSILTGHCLPDYTTYTTSFFKFEEDTIIDGKTYKMVFISEDEFQEEWFFFGSFIREDNKKVYLREYFGEEGLIYDFNLQLGDTVVVNNPRAVSEVALVLTEIDSVETSDGYRERWKLTNEEFLIPEYWIEGIGSTGGILNSSTEVFGGLCGTYILLCEEENGNTIYLNPEYEQCYYLLLNNAEEQEALQISYKLIYKPSIRAMELIFNEHGKRHILVSDIQGRTIARFESEENNVQLPLNSYTNGLYMVSILQDDGRFTSKKMMVY